MQSQKHGVLESLPRHVAIIMDGNGRWATRRGWPRIRGHREGAEAVRRNVEAAVRFHIRTLTLYAFSSDNWHRPRREVLALMDLFRESLETERLRCLENGVRLQVIGRRNRLPTSLRLAIDTAETATARGGALDLRIAVDYSARDSILRAATRLGENRRTNRKTFARMLAQVNHASSTTPEVDLLIRTGGEKRLSDFLLWESAYAELYFTERMWPDFDAHDFETALATFQSRKRRFGRVLSGAQ